MDSRNDNSIISYVNHPSSRTPQQNNALHVYTNIPSNPTNQTIDQQNDFQDPDPDPKPSSNNGASNSRKQSSPSPPLAVQPAAVFRVQEEESVRYRECLKNHAASMGTRVVDGCGEFMPNGEEGTAEALKCAACDCHRNFHRKEENGVVYPLLAVLPPAPAPTPQTQQPRHSFITMPPPLPPLSRSGVITKNNGSSPVMMSFGYGGGGAESSSEDLFQGGTTSTTTTNRKRFRTKFTQEQKDKMQEFAEKVGWKFQKQDEQELKNFCEEVGIKRQVLKVWMHNNKQSLKKKEI